jgi:hypothetical protein
MAGWMNARLTPHPWKCFNQPLRLKDQAAVDHIPRTHINCSSSLRVRQEEALERVLGANRVWEIDTGHDLMLTEPEAVASMLLRLALIGEGQGALE